MLRSVSWSHAMSLLPVAVARRITNRDSFVDDLIRYHTMSDAELLRVTEVCLKNLGRLDLDDAATRPDWDLRIILVPELCERIAPGMRDHLRRITDTLAEYHPDTDRPSIFARLLSPGSLQRLHERADDLRQRISQVVALDVDSLVDQTRFAIAGSGAADRWSPSDCVYEPGFAYRLVPVVALRALARSSGVVAGTGRTAG